MILKKASMDQILNSTPNESRKIYILLSPDRVN